MNSKNIQNKLLKKETVELLNGINYCEVSKASVQIMLERFCNGKDIGLGVSITNPELVKVSMIGIGLLSDEIEHVLGIPAEECCLCSAKTGEGIDAILEAVIANVPEPKESKSDQLKALMKIFEYSSSNCFSSISIPNFLRDVFL